MSRYWVKVKKGEDACIMIIRSFKDDTQISIISIACAYTKGRYDILNFFI